MELSIEEKWTDVLLGRFENMGCYVISSFQEGDAPDSGQHIIYQTPNGQLRHTIFRFQGLAEPKLLLDTPLMMIRPPRG